MSKFQSNGADGFDITGCPTAPSTPLPDGEIYAVPGCALMINLQTFHWLGGFDPQMFMYCDEADLAWKLAACDLKAITVTDALVAHWPESAGSAEKRFYATRNAFLVILKNAQHLLLLLCVPMFLFTLFEALVVLASGNGLKFIWNAYGKALLDLWRLRHHIRSQRYRMKVIRKHGDFYMLRYLRLRPARLPMIKRCLRPSLIDYLDHPLFVFPLCGVSVIVSLLFCKLFCVARIVDSHYERYLFLLTPAFALIELGAFLLADKWWRKWITQ